MFDTNSSDSQSVQTVQIEDKKITKILANIGGNYIDYRAAVEYEDGSRTIIFDKSNKDCGTVREIPNGYCIVGIYGMRPPGGVIRHLGFIVARFD